MVDERSVVDDVASSKIQLLQFVDAVVNVLLELVQVFVAVEVPAGEVLRHPVFVSNL